MTDDPGLTLEEAAEVLDPPVTAHQLRLLVEAAGMQPCGQRRTGWRGRPPLCYPASQLMRAHAALIPLLSTTSPATASTPVAASQ